jgi:anti-sigma regulatory factor (Ser/Thr protein kinase)
MLCIRYQQPALVMRNDIQQIPTLPEWLDALQLPEELTMPINLALEEAVTNVMLYAYPGRHGSVLVEFVPPMTFTITDSGIPFDPTQKEEADISLSAEEREIGGLGIHLVRQIMDEVLYERIDDKNVLTLIKHI